MIDMTYDPEADAAYIYLGRAEIDHTEEAGPFIHDVDAKRKEIARKAATKRCGKPSSG